jgi:integrase
MVEPMASQTDQTWQVEKVRWRRAWTRGNRSEATITSYISLVDKYRFWCAEKELDSATNDAADLYTDHLQRESLHTARYFVRAIRSYGSYLAAENGTANPYEKLQAPPQPAPTAKTAAMATEGDLEKLLGDCDPSEEAGRRDIAIITMLAHTGMRRGEVANLLTKDADLIGQSIAITKGKNKAAKRTVHMDDAVQGTLFQYLKRLDPLREPEEPLWTSSSSRNRLLANGIGQMLKTRGRRVGVDIRAHAFRRMYAGEWIKRGGTETGLMATAGWSGTQMIAHYTRDIAEQNAMDEAKRLFE